MKVVVLIYSLGGGGAERVTSILANRLVARGHAVEVGLFDGSVAPHYSLAGAVTVVDLDLAGEPASRWDAALLLFRRVRKVRRWLRESKAELAIGMMTSSAVLLALARPGLSAVVVGAERTYPAAFPLPALWESLRRHTYRMLDAVVAQTDATRQWLLTHTKARTVAVIGNPIERLPVTGVGPSPAAYLTPRAVIIIAAGRLVAEKGFDRLIDAFAKAGPGAEPAELAILGEGPLREPLLRQAAALGVAERVHLPGNVANLGAWLEASDIFVLSSHFEGMPNALLEAMAHGLACAAYDIPSGTREFIKDGVNGLLVDPTVPDGLAQALTRLVADVPLRRNLGGAAAAHVAANYAPERIVDQWLALAAPRARGESA